MVSEEDAGSAGKDHYYLGGSGREQDHDQPGVWPDDGGGVGSILDSHSSIYQTALLA